MLYDYLRDKNIQHKKCGKIVFSVDAVTDESLAHIRDRALLNDVKFDPIPTRKIKNIELISHAKSAFFSPESGIFDTHSYLDALLTDLEHGGGILSLGARVLNIADEGTVLHLNVCSNNEHFVIETKKCFLCTGNQTLNYLKSMLPIKYNDYQNSYKKGHYFAYKRSTNLDYLLYPVPEPGGLGVHMTVDLGGSLRFGPDVTPSERPDDYRPGVSAEDFLEKVKKNFPYVEATDINFIYSGVRPNLKRNNKNISDFKIFQDFENKLISSLNYESPGLTASMSFAKSIVDDYVDF